MKWMEERIRKKFGMLTPNMWVKTVNMGQWRHWNETGSNGEQRLMKLDKANDIKKESDSIHFIYNISPNTRICFLSHVCCRNMILIHKINFSLRMFPNRRSSCMQNSHSSKLAAYFITLCKRLLVLKIITVKRLVHQRKFSFFSVPPNFPDSCLDLSLKWRSDSHTCIANMVKYSSLKITWKQQGGRQLLTYRKLTR
jgi:hypothetical protein